MIKKTKERDYESAPHTKRLTAGDSDVYVMNPQTIFHRMLDGSGDPFYLDNTRYTNSSLETSSLTVTQTGGTTETNRLLFKSEVFYGEDFSLAQKDFFTELGSLSTETHTIEDGYFNNSRLLISKTGGAVMAISHHASTHQIYSKNERTMRSNINPEVSLELKAPRIAGIGTEKATQQFYSIIQSHVLTINALSQVLRGRPANDVFVFTPEGRYYPTEKQRAKVSKIIDIKASEPKKAEAPAPVPQPEVPTERMMLDDIGGLETVRAELKRVAVSFNHAEEMKKWGAERPQGVLLYGPPGTGKTSLANALANEIEGDLWEIKGTEIFARWLGDSEKNITKIFDEAKQKTRPTVMLFDEFEALIDSSDGGTPSRTASSVVGIFKKEATALREANPNVIMVATTNHIDRIDDSLIRAGRFDVKAYVELPPEAARVQIFATKIADTISKLRSETFIPISDDVNTLELAQKTDGMSGADITEILRRASFAKAMQEAQKGDTEVAPINNADLLAIIRDMRTS